MRKLFLIFFAVILNAEILSPLKKQEFKLSKSSSIEDAISIKKSWLNPILLKYSLTKDNSLGVARVVNQFSLSINQPIFKSGAIYYSIKYASLLKNLGVDNVKFQKKLLLKNAYDLVFNYKLSLIQKEIIKINIENAKIEVKKKREDFLKGIESSIDLNNAILKLNSLKLSLVDVKKSLLSIKNSFSKISSKNIEDINFPKLHLISKSEYLNNNLSYITSKKKIKLSKYLYLMQRGNQLLSINLLASINHQGVRYLQKSPNFQNDRLNFYNIGISISLPISFNGINKIEKSKLDYLKSRVEFLNKKKEIELNYDDLVNKLNLIDKKIEIYKNNLKVYDSLIKAIEENIKSGSMTKEDLETILNSKKIMELHIKELRLQKENILLQLYLQI